MDAKNIVDLIKKQEEKQNRRKIVVMLFLIICSVSFIIFISLIIFKTEKTNEYLFVNNDSLKAINTSYAVIEYKKEKARNCISYYFSRKNIKDADSIRNIFTEKLSRYYTYTEIKRDSIITEDYKYWKKYPNDILNYDDDFAVEVFPGDTIKCLINGKYSKDRKEFVDIVQEIRLNSEFKIFYVRAFYSNNTQ